MAEKSGLSNRQRKFVEAMASGATVTKAALFAGVAERTARRYASDPNVKQALAVAQDAALGDVVRRLNAGSHTVLGVLLKIMADKEVAAGVRVRACDVWLSHAFKARELLDLSGRIAALEVKLDERLGKQD